MTARFDYFRRMAFDRIRGRNLSCPNCGNISSALIDRKYLVTELRRCASCRLMFRAPTDSSDFNESFYNDGYEQGFTTDMPDDSELARLQSCNFVGSPKDYSFYIAILDRLGLKSGSRLFDFGCFWGYGPWQFRASGFDVWASEISRPRRAYAAAKLDVRIVDDPYGIAFLGEFGGTFDCFFSAHVLEHVPKPREIFDLAALLLRPGGLFVSFTPNGGAEHRTASPRWSRLWGAVHPNFIDSEFMDYSFSAASRLATSTRREPEWLRELRFPPTDDSRRRLEASELLFAAALPSSRSWQAPLAA